MSNCLFHDRHDAPAVRHCKRCGQVHCHCGPCAAERHAEQIAASALVARISRLYHSAKNRGYADRTRMTLEGFRDWYLAHRDDLCPCGEFSTHMDHEIALVRGGMHEPANFRMLCAGCNILKGASLPGEDPEQIRFMPMRATDE